MALPKTDRGNSRFLSEVESLVRHWESAELPLEEMPINAVGQRRRGRQDAGSADQGWAKPQDGGEEERMMPHFGMSLKQVAKKHGISRASVCRIVKQSAFAPVEIASAKQPAWR